MKKKKKILHLITGLEVGGAEMMLLKTLPRLQDTFDNRVCCIRGRGPMAEKLQEAGIPVFFLDLKSFFDLGSILRFRRIVKDFQPKILVTYLIHADLFGRVFGRVFGIRKIVCNQRGKLLQWEFLRILDRLTTCLVTKYIVQTSVAREELVQKLHLPEERFEIIPNAIDTKEFDFTFDTEKKQKELNILPNETTLICVSNLRRNKGHEYLLEAFEKIEKHNIKLLIVGDGERKEELKNQTKNYTSRKRILFLGKRYDVKELLKISTIFILPTLGEGMSNAIMEAMACGVTVITTDIPENRELINHEKTGILVPPRNSDALAKAIERLIADPMLRDRLGASARTSIEEHFDVSVVTKRMQSFLKSL